MKKKIFIVASLALAFGFQTLQAQEIGAPMVKHGNHFDYKEQVYAATAEHAETNAEPATAELDKKFKISLGASAINFLGGSAEWLQGQTLESQHLIGVIASLTGGFEYTHGFPTIAASYNLTNSIEIGGQLIYDEFKGSGMNLKYFAADVFTKFSLNAGEVLSPYGKIGFGSSSVFDAATRNNFVFASNLSKDSSLSASAAVGVDVNLSDNFGLFYEFAFRNAFETYAQKHAVNSIGLYFRP